ncbi:MAG: RNA methyltransferase [Eubacteriales bacterium]|jgi:TrmH family RNA methyltransferase
MITSISNAQVKEVIRLLSKAKERHTQGCFVAEGIKLFCETPEELRRRVYVSESFLQNPEHLEMMHSCGVVAENENSEEFVTAVTVSDDVFRKMSDTQTPQGIMTVASIPEYSREQLLGNGVNPLVMVLEDLQDPGNVGTIIRTAEGAGVTGIFMSSHTADCFQPKVVRATMGSVYRVPVRREDSLVELTDWLRSRGVTAYAAHLRGKRSYTREDYTGGTAFLIGNEGNGLSDRLTEAAGVLVRIPMEGKVESLNAAVASALLMYEAHRQRDEE